LSVQSIAHNNYGYKTTTQKGNYKMDFDALSSTWMPSTPHNWNKVWLWPLTSNI